MVEARIRGLTWVLAGAAWCGEEQPQARPGEGRGRQMGWEGGRWVEYDMSTHRGRFESGDG